MKIFLLVLILLPAALSKFLKPSLANFANYITHPNITLHPNSIEATSTIPLNTVVITYPLSSLITSLNPPLRSEFEPCTDRGALIDYCYINFMNVHRADKDTLGALITELIDKQLDYPVYFGTVENILLQGSFFLDNLQIFRDSFEKAFLEYTSVFKDSKINRETFIDIYLVFKSNATQLNFHEKLAIVPLYDRIGFSSVDGNVEFIFTFDEDKAVVQTTREIKAGEKLEFHTDKANSDLLLNYGFLLKDNSNSVKYKIPINGETFVINANINNLGHILDVKSKSINIVRNRVKLAKNTFSARISNYKFSFETIAEKLQKIEDSNEKDILLILKEELFVLKQYLVAFEKIDVFLERFWNELDSKVDIKEEYSKLDSFLANL